MLGGIARSRVQHEDNALHNQGFNAPGERKISIVVGLSQKIASLESLSESTKSAMQKMNFFLARWRKRFHVFKSVIMIFIFFTSNCIFFSYFEEWTILETVYFSVVTITTTGYGDLKPTSDTSRLYTMFVIIFGVVLIFSTIQDFGNRIIGYGLRTSKLLHDQAQLMMLDKEKRGCFIEERDRIRSRKTVADIEEENIRRHVNELIIQFVVLVCLILMGSLFFSYNEYDLTYFQALYFCIVTSASVGYGDIIIYEDSSMVFAIFYILTSVVLVTSSIGSFAGLSLQYRAAEKRKKLAMRKLDFEMLNSMDKNGDGISRIEFLSYILVRTLDIDMESDIDPWLRRFDELDADGSGFLTKEDIDILKAKEDDRLHSLEELFQKEKRRRFLRTTLLDFESPRRSITLEEARERFNSLFRRDSVTGQLRKGTFSRMSILMIRRKTNNVANDPSSPTSISPNHSLPKMSLLLEAQLMTQEQNVADRDTNIDDENDCNTTSNTGRSNNKTTALKFEEVRKESNV